MRQLTHVTPLLEGVLSKVTSRKQMPSDKTVPDEVRTTSSVA